MSLLRNFEVLDTRLLDKARHVVGQRFCSHRLETLGSAGEFHVKHCVVEGNTLSLSRLSYGAAVLIEPGELENFYLVQIPIAGCAEIENGTQNFLSNTRVASILNPDRHSRMRWHAECEQLMVYLPKDKFRTVAEKLFGRQLSSELVFCPKMEFKDADLARWRSHVLMLANAADKGELFGGDEPFNQRLIEEMIMVDLLRYQPSNVRCFSDAGGLLNKSVKCARDYIFENAARPITVGDIAEASGVPIRTLQHHFERALGASPLKYLRNERLRRVHHELNSGHCDEGVAYVAARWGFSHFGRFSKHYKHLFGELPSHTREQGNVHRLSRRVGAAEAG